MTILPSLCLTLGSLFNNIPLPPPSPHCTCIIFWLFQLTVEVPLLDVGTVLDTGHTVQQAQHYELSVWQSF